MLARAVEPALPIKLLPLPLPMPPFEQAMQWHKHRSLDPGLLWLRDVMKQAAQALPAGGAGSGASDQ